MTRTRFTIVFTGTQSGMTEPQKKLVLKLFAHGERLYHGCCIGADKEAHDLWVARWDDCQSVTGYPSNLAAKRVYCATGLNHAPAPPIVRNHRMIDDALAAGMPLCVAAPKGMQEELRSGTWATVRYARKQNVPVFVCWPDGTWDWDVIEGVLADVPAVPSNG